MQRDCPLIKVKDAFVDRISLVYWTAITSPSDAFDVVAGAGDQSGF